jgi:hypothetical protein
MPGCLMFSACSMKPISGLVASFSTSSSGSLIMAKLPYSPRFPLCSLSGPLVCTKTLTRTCSRARRACAPFLSDLTLAFLASGAMPETYFSGGRGLISFFVTAKHPVPAARTAFTEGSLFSITRNLGWTRRFQLSSLACATDVVSATVG